MPVVMWIVLAVAAGVGFMALLVRAGLGGERGAPLDLPEAPMQRLARRSLVVSLLLSVLLVGFVAVFGVERTETDDAVRIGFELLLVGVFAVFAVMTIRLASWLRRQDGTVDERDLRILGRSHGATSVAILFTLAIWQIVLVERFHSAGAIPIPWFYVMFWSCVVVGLISMPLGVLIGYARH